MLLMVRAFLLLGAAAAQHVTFGGGSAGHVEYVYRPVAGRVGGGNPFGGIVPGMLMMAGSSALLWWNEGRTVREERMLREAHAAVVSIDTEEPFNYEGAPVARLVHMSGKVSSSSLADPMFPTVRRPALRLKRTVEAYQWEETEHTREMRVSSTHVKRETSYTYRKNWSARPVDSGRFRSSSHHNPTPQVRPHEEVAVASDARFRGGVRLSPQLLSQLNEWEAVPLQREGGPTLPAGFGGYVAQTGNGADAIHLPSPRALARGVSAYSVEEAVPEGLAARRLHPPSEVAEALAAERGDERGDEVSAMPRVQVARPPEVGDSRVSYREVNAPADGVSVLGAVGRDGDVWPWRPAGRLHGHSLPELYMARAGAVGPAELLREAASTASAKKWALRGAGWLLLWGGSWLSL